MLAFDPVACDAFRVYDVDFMKELRIVASEGCADTVLTLRPLTHATGENQDWSDFRWQPDGPYFCFVQVAVISFIAVVASMQAELSVVVSDMPQLVIPAWLRRDLIAVRARFQHRGDAKERGMAIIKGTMANAGRHRTLDPLMLHSILANAGLKNESGLTDFHTEYNRMVGFDRDLCLPERAMAVQSALMSGTRSQSLVVDSPSPHSMKLKRNIRSDKYGSRATGFQTSLRQDNFD